MSRDADPTDQHGLPLWPAPERNKQPIAEVLRAVLPERGLLLEIASGTGQHAAHFVDALPGWTIQPSDREPEHLETLARRVAIVANPRLLPPRALDVTAEPTGIEADAIFCANMIHIAPWAATVGLFRLAGAALRPAGLLVTYGPYARQGAHTADSNQRFDLSLRERDPAWGVRDVDDLEVVAREHSLRLEDVRAMPANNLTLVWRRD